jgi:outer membrane protein OmpA-like peptidoglycan-associated protein/Tol biopolymer transport system component
MHPGKYIFALISLPAIFCISMMIPVCGFTQGITAVDDLGKKESKWFQEAKASQRRGKNDKALELYNKIIEKYPGAIEAILGKSGIFYNQKDYDASAELLLEALALDSEYNKEIYFSLGLIYAELNQYNKAKNYIREYLNRTKPSENKYSRATDLLTSYTFIAECMSNPVPFDPIALPETINTSEPEYTPGISADGSQFFFVRRIKGQEDIMVSAIVDSSFSEPVPVEEILTMDNEGVFALSPDGQTIIFTACNRREGMGSCDLFYTYKDKYGKWSRPSNMGKKVNSVAWDSQPSLSADGKTLFFSSRRFGSIGHSDIWTTTWSPGDGWSPPSNLGGMINSTGSDETPFIHPDGKTLYFRSNGRVGMGDFDMYVSRYDEELGEWGEPMNLGYPINTAGSEGGLIVSLDGTKAYYSSDTGGDDVNIYEFELYPEARPSPATYVKIQVKDAITGEPLEANLTIDNQVKKTTEILATDINGSRLVALPTGSNYGCSIEKEGYLFYSEYFNLDSVSTIIDPYILKVSLIPIEEENLIEDKPIVLNNIFFKFGSAELESTSIPEINRLVRLLQVEEHFNIIIIGHTDNIGKKEDNLKLSSDRARSVQQALIDGGISSDRITYIGKGEHEPIASNDTSEGRRKNRRTEFILSRKS